MQSIPVVEVLPLNQETYAPRNSTALLDAIGRTIDELGQSLSRMPSADRSGQVIVAILTDGLENASTKFSWNDVAQRIKRQTELYKWTFLFLGANQDAIATAAQINIAAVNAATYVGDEAGSRASHRALSRKVHSLRAMGAGTVTAEEAHAAEAPMSTLLEEEDRKERGT